MNTFGARTKLNAESGDLSIYSLNKLTDSGIGNIERLPFCIKVLLENLLRNEDGQLIKAEDVEQMANWGTAGAEAREVPFMPARVLLQDFTGVPSVVDLAVMRNAAHFLGKDPMKINPKIPVELVIDHSVQVDYFGASDAFEKNIEKEYERNFERYAFLRWGQKSFDNFKVVPPATGICHQVNLEYLARVVFVKGMDGENVAFPDTLVGLDSHTTMINGIGVMGWGVGGIEAEAVMLGRPYYMLTPQVVGFKLKGELPRSATATDLVLRVTEILRKKGVVGKFVEFFGPGYKTLNLENRATIANMSPEYGATMGFFPVDEKTLDYLRLTGRSASHIKTVEAYCKEQGLFRTDAMPDPIFSDVVELDMSEIEPCLAGPKRPQDRIPLTVMKKTFHATLKKPQKSVDIEYNGEKFRLSDGHVVIAAITSCTNTSNPSVLLGAGLLARKAVDKGLTAQPWVKTSLAPGSKVVTRYLEKSGLLPELEKLGFHLAAYGCTTCIGNSGSLPEPISKAVKEKDLTVLAVLSGNRNFEGRINPQTKENYLTSPLLVVAYALAGTIDIDFETEAIGTGKDGNPVYLRDIWPEPSEIEDAAKKFVETQMYTEEYDVVFEGGEKWKKLPTTESSLYEWDEDSTYIKKPPFFDGISAEPSLLEDIRGAKVLAFLGNSVTTDHISPAGAIPKDSPAAEWLVQHGVKPDDFNSYGSRRGNHEVMMRGTFGNIRLQNLLVPGVSGGWTRYLPEDRQTSIYEAAMRYQSDKTPLIVIAGKEYGTGSSRDWAAKGTSLLGVKAVIAKSFERIHRSNLVCMGVLPLEFLSGDDQESLGLDGEETYDIIGIESDFSAKKKLTVIAHKKDGAKTEFTVVTRLDSPVEVEYYKHGGILNYVLRYI